MDPCPRCGGFVINEYGEIRCIPCGWRYVELFVPQTLYCRWTNCLNEAMPGIVHCPVHQEWYRAYNERYRARLKGAA